MKNIYVLFFGILVLSLSACQKSRIVLSKQFDNDIWNSFDDVELKTKIDNSKTYQINIIISVSKDFEPSYFSFGFSQNSEEGESVYSNYKVPIKDANRKFLEKSVDGFYKYNIVVRKKAVFNSKGEYSFKFENIMDKYDMKGVHLIGLEITEL